MKLKFKKQAFQDEAVRAVADCFAGQPKVSAAKYAIDPGRMASGEPSLLPGMESEGFANARLVIPEKQILENLQAVQRRRMHPVSDKMVVTPVSKLNLDIEMETGTGKTYCYIKTMFELHREYGWSKFIVVVPSIAIREGVLKSFEIMADHFLEEYGKRARLVSFATGRPCADCFPLIHWLLPPCRSRTGGCFVSARPHARTPSRLKSTKSWASSGKPCLLP